LPPETVKFEVSIVEIDGWQIRSIVNSFTRQAYEHELNWYPSFHEMEVVLSLVKTIEIKAQRAFDESKLGEYPSPVTFVIIPEILHYARKSQRQQILSTPILAAIELRCFPYVCWLCIIEKIFHSTCMRPSTDRDAKRKESRKRISRLTTRTHKYRNTMNRLNRESQPFVFAEDYL
jgi:hypothetical protein